MTDQAIVLAGGLGTRLQHVIADIPKPMAEVAGKPFLEFIMLYLAHQGIHHVILAVGHKREVIMDYFGNNFLGIKVSYSIEEEPLGTGGAIFKASTLLDKGPAFIINGDTFFNVNLRALFKFHKKNKSSLTLALKPMQKFERYGTVELQASGIISAFKEKKFVEDGLINGGVYCIEKEIFNKTSAEKFSFETEILEKGVNSNSIYGLEFDTYFIDIGIPEDYEKAQVDFTNNRHI